MTRAMIFLVLGILTMSCSPRLTPLSDEVIKDYKLGPAELQKIQFYTSQDIVLSRRAETGDLSIRSGKIKVIDGEKVEQVVIPARTPGVFVTSPKNDRIAVSFEKDNQHFLVFGPNPRKGNQYTLLGKEWKRKGGKITYGASTWWTPVESSFTTLMVDMSKARKVKVKSHRVKGRTL